MMRGAVALVLLATLAWVPGAQASCQIFEHRDFSGQSITIPENAAQTDLGALNDKASSIKISRQCILVAFADPDFRGATTTFSPGDHPNLIEGWDDQISSARCNCR